MPGLTVAVAVLATARSAAVVTVVIAVEVLFKAFGSGVALVTFAVFAIEPVAPGLILMVTENVADADGRKDAIEQVMVPVPPTAGVEHENAGPVVCDSPANVVFAGIVSLSETLVAVDGPLLVTVIV